MSHGDSFKGRRFVLAEFDTTDALLDGTTTLREKGFKNLDTHTPYPVHGIEEALGLGRPFIPKIVLCFAILGILTAYSMIHYMNVIDWPINVANRPIHAPPANIPITFELAVLFGGCSSFFGVMFLMRLPKHYHPVFQSQRFCDKASIDGFFLSVEMPHDGDPAAVQAAVKELGASHIEVIDEVER